MTTITKPTRIYKVWLDRLAEPGITYGHLNQFCQAIAGDGGKATALTDDEKFDLFERAEARWYAGGYDLYGHCPNGPWKEYGNTWLRRHGDKLASDFRSDRQWCPPWVIEFAAKQALDFRWVNVSQHYNGWRTQCKPVYRAIAMNDPQGRTWDYYAWPWQGKAYG